MEYIDGPNCYIYCNQNPWSKFDPEGLEIKVTGSVTDKIAIYSQLIAVSIVNPKQGCEIIGLATSKNVHEYRTPSADAKLNGGKSDYHEYGPFSKTTSPGADTNGKGSGSLTVYDPYSRFSIADEKGNELFSMHPLVVLSHETKHNSDKDKGIINRADNADGTQPISEDRAIETENITAKSIGEPDRKHHDPNAEKARRDSAKIQKAEATKNEDSKENN